MSLIVSILFILFSIQSALFSFFMMDIQTRKTFKTPYHVDKGMSIPIPFNLYFTDQVHDKYFFTFKRQHHDIFTNDQFLNERDIDQALDKTFFDFLQKRYLNFQDDQLFYILKSDLEESNSELQNFDMALSPQDVIASEILVTDQSPKSHLFFMQLSPDQWVPPGLYKDIITISLYEGDINQKYNSTFIQSSQVEIGINVKSISDLNVLSERISFHPKNNESSLLFCTVQLVLNVSSNDVFELVLKSIQGISFHELLCNSKKVESLDENTYLLFSSKDGRVVRDHQLQLSITFQTDQTSPDDFSSLPFDVLMMM